MCVKIVFSDVDCAFGTDLPLFHCLAAYQYTKFSFISDYAQEVHCCWKHSCDKHFCSECNCTRFKKLEKSTHSISCLLQSVLSC